MMLCKHGPDLGFPAPTSKSGVTMHACNRNAGARETGRSLGSDDQSHWELPVQWKTLSQTNKRTNSVIKEDFQCQPGSCVQSVLAHTYASTHMHETHIHTPIKNKKDSDGQRDESGHLLAKGKTVAHLDWCSGTVSGQLQTFWLQTLETKQKQHRLLPHPSYHRAPMASDTVCLRTAQHFPLSTGVLRTDKTVTR